MDAFESIVAGLLWEDGYWISVGYKVNLSKAAKVGLGKPSLPRPEIDILAYRAKDNSVLWVECKSYLDSRGVKIEALTGEDERGKKRYNVFTWSEYRKVITKELIDQLVANGRVQPQPSVKYCLVTGKIATDTDRKKLHAHFQKNGWILYDEHWVKEGLEQMAKKGYENDVAIQVAKLFSRIR